MKLPKYVQAWVDRRDDRAYILFRCVASRVCACPACPGRPSFMAEIREGDGRPRTAIGAGRIKPGSVAAVVAEYFNSQASRLEKRGHAKDAARHP